ncbi:hypothetical protein CVT26_006883 [Gymnopilus dilepis]|uniref:F-box domain-containing protein n=1 Tax=Gymnopilus dilepis TaxID=231916 RepID=A0A409W0S6_9AGAR|nr:hypothetical protein CVT26_006883 [Gymnopilus dilepis]
MDVSFAPSWLSSFPFLEHMKSNYIPSDDEVSRIRTLLLEPVGTLQKVEDKIGRLTEELQTLWKIRDELKGQIDAATALIATSRRLPDDVLREIFQQCLPANRNTPLKKTGAPWLFTQVCRRWRQVALETPSLWATIHISIDTMKTTPKFNDRGWPTQVATQDDSLMRHQTRALAVGSWLARSRSLPVSISFYGGSPKLVTKQSFDTYLDAVIPFASRWSSVLMEAHCDSLIQLASLRATDLPRLKALFVYFNQLSDIPWNPLDQQSPWYGCGLFAAPGLRKLSSRQDSLDPKSFGVNWSQLTHLELSGSPRFNMPSGSKFLSEYEASILLKECINLVYCMIYLSGGFYGRQSRNIQEMRLPFLRRLSIGEGTDIGLFVEKLEVPELCELQYWSTVKSISTSSCLTLLSSTRGSVRKLSLRFEYLEHDLFIQCLQHCPSLVSLDITRPFEPTLSDSEDDASDYGYYGHHHEGHSPFKCFTIDDHVLKRLGGRASPLCPNLEEFICRFEGDFSLSGFLDFLARKQGSMTSGVSKLKRLSIYCLPDPQDDGECDLEVNGTIRSYIEEGLLFQNKCDRFREISPWKRVVGDEYFSEQGCGHAAVQYSDVWDD